MTDTPLRELLTDLTRDPAAQALFEADPSGWLASHGHDLSDDLVAEAVGSVSAVLPVEVAEHLAPFTIATSPIPSIDDGPRPDGLDGLDGLGLLSSAPDADADEGHVDRPDGFDDGAGQFGAGASAAAVDGAGTDGFDTPGDSFDDLHASVPSLGATSGIEPIDPRELPDGSAGLDLDVDDPIAPAIGDAPADLDGLD